MGKSRKRPFFEKENTKQNGTSLPSKGAKRSLKITKQNKRKKKNIKSFQHTHTQLLASGGNYDMKVKEVHPVLSVICSFDL